MYQCILLSVREYPSHHVTRLRHSRHLDGYLPIHSVSNMTILIPSTTFHFGNQYHCSRLSSLQSLRFISCLFDQFQFYYRRCFQLHVSCNVRSGQSYVVCCYFKQFFTHSGLFVSKLFQCTKIIYCCNVTNYVIYRFKLSFNRVPMNSSRCKP